MGYAWILGMYAASITFLLGQPTRTGLYGLFPRGTHHNFSVVNLFPRDVPRVLNLFPRELIKGTPKDFSKANLRPHQRPFFIAPYLYVV